MSDFSILNEPPREIQPHIPSNHELKDWRGVFLHFSKADRAIPTLFRGLWSVSFSHQKGVNMPMESSGFSPVQEEEGWEWISAYDSDDKNIPWHRVAPFGENITVVTKKLPFKSRDTNAERKMVAEKLIKWRVAPRDIVALWVSDSMEKQTVSDFIDKDLSNEGMERLYKQFNQLSRRNDNWREKMVQASNEAVKKASTKYSGANYQLVGEIAKGTMTKALALQ